MEKTFAHATLLSATVITAYMVLSPPAHLSAQSEIKIDSSVHFHKAIIQDVDFKQNVLVVELDSAKGVPVPVEINASTTITLGNGNETELPSLRTGAAVYVFGNYDPSTHSIEAEKVVVRNKPITGRTTMSRADIEKSKTLRAVPEQKNEETSFETLGLLQAN